MLKEQHMKKDIISHLSKDPVLIPLIKQFDLAPIENPKTVEHALCSSIISQQLSIKAAETIYTRFMDLFPNLVYSGKELLTFDHDLVRSAGLSNNKVKYVKNVALFFKENNLDKMDWSSQKDDEVIQLLTQIKGVGVWTAQMILMFKLDRQDVFPHLDLGIRNGIIKLYNIEPSQKALNSELFQIANSWRPYRTYACRLIWASLS